VRVETIVVTSPRTHRVTARRLAELERRNRSLRVRQEEGVGFAAALNTGIRAAAAARVGFLLSDDWLDPRAVEACLASDADIVSTGLRGYAADGVSILEDIGRVPTLAEFHRQPTRERQASYLQHFFLLRRRAVLDAGGVDEAVGLTGPDDFDLVWTMLDRGASVSTIGEQLYNYRDHAGERLSLRSAEAQVRDLCRILDKHGIEGAERDEIIAWHASAYGRPFHVAVAERRDRAALGFA